MKLLVILSILVVGLGVAAPQLSAQSCPFMVSNTSYGSSCSDITTSLPSLVALPTNGTSCDVQFFHSVPAICCNVQLTNRWFVAGLAPASLPLLGGGCTLLVTPLIIVDLPALEGTIAPLLLLPANPMLIGISIYVQCIDRRFDTVAGTQHFETTNGLKLNVQ